MMINLMDLETTYLKDQRELQESIARARSSLTDRYDPNLRSIDQVLSPPISGSLEKLVQEEAD
jgi:hypothetical protein